MYCGCNCKTLHAEGNTCPGCGMIMTTDKRVDRLLRIIETISPASIVCAAPVVNTAIPEIISGQGPRQAIPEVFMAQPQFAQPMAPAPVENIVSEVISERGAMLVKLGLMRATINETPRWSMHPTNGVEWKSLHVLQQEAIRLEHPSWSDAEVSMVRWNGPVFNPPDPIQPPTAAQMRAAATLGTEGGTGLRKAKLRFALCPSSVKVGTARHSSRHREG